MTFKNISSLVCITKYNFNRESIQSFFGYYGDIKHCLIEKLENNFLKIFICYNQAISATKAINELNNFKILNEILILKTFFNYIEDLKKNPNLNLIESSTDEYADDSNEEIIITNKKIKNKKKHHRHHHKKHHKLNHLI